MTSSTELPVPLPAAPPSARVSITSPEPGLLVQNLADDVNIIVVKKAFPVIGRVLLRIINKRTVSSGVPDKWKSAHVIPLHKKDSLSKAANFRPIANVPVVCKIVEKIVFQQLDIFMRRNHLYSPDQHGFRASYSTATALATVSDSERWAMDRGDVSLLTLIELSRCFDVVDHEVLLTQLQLLQIDPRSRLTGMQRGMECVLDTLGTYFMQNGMCVNTSKTELLFAGGRQQLAATHHTPRVQFMGATLEPVTQVETRGLIMDSRLTYEPHIDNVVKRCNGILIGLLHARHILPRKILPLPVDTLVLSHCAVTLLLHSVR